MGLTGNITFTINGGTPFALTTLQAGFVGGATATNDVEAFGTNSLPGVSVGDTIIFNPGTVSTTMSFNVTPPSGHSFGTFVSDNVGDQISTAGVPEPSAWVTLLGGLTLLGGVRRLRRRS